MYKRRETNKGKYRDPSPSASLRGRMTTRRVRLLRLVGVVVEDSGVGFVEVG
jgi:hypothetical protein